MPQSPFPGMDPYLEAPDLWQDVHTRLMNIFAEQLTPRLAPSYVSRSPRPALTPADHAWARALPAHAALSNN